MPKSTTPKATEASADEVLDAIAALIRANVTEDPYVFGVTVRPWSQVIEDVAEQLRAAGRPT
jgi:hypothetical protein